MSSRIKFSAAGLNLGRKPLLMTRIGPGIAGRRHGTPPFVLDWYMGFHGLNV